MIGLGDTIRDGESIFIVTNLLDIDGDETNDIELIHSVVAQGEEGWLTIEVDQLQYRKRQ